MINQMNTWLKNPVYFRYAFGVILGINAVFYCYHSGTEPFLVLDTLAIICLGIGFYNYPSWSLTAVSTLLVSCLILLTYESPSLLNFLILEITYILILHISVEFMSRSEKVRESNIELLATLAKALDSRDAYTADHSYAVARYAVYIAEEMGLSRDKIETLKIGGLLHDLGKIGIPEPVLLKPGKLTDEEYKIIRNHPVIGYEMIKHVNEYKEKGILDIVLYHHERFDGTGYPQGLKGKQIPLLAQIIAVADTFDAMTSKRVYRDEIDIMKTLVEIERNKGTQFDPEVTDAFLSLFESEKYQVAFIKEFSLSENDRRKITFKF